MKKNLLAPAVALPLAVVLATCTATMASADEVSSQTDPAPVVTTTPQTDSAPAGTPSSEDASTHADEGSQPADPAPAPASPVAPKPVAPVNTTAQPPAPAPAPAPKVAAPAAVVVQPQVESTPVADTTKPVATLQAAPSVFNSSNVDFVINATDETALAKVVGNIRNAAGVIVKPAQAAASGLSGSLTIDLSGLSNGTYTLRYNALDAAGNVAPTQEFTFTVDNTAPTVTVKPESIGSDGLYRTVSFKLYDAGKVDKVVLNGTTKDLSNNVWSDLNGVTKGVFGAVEGVNTLQVYDVAGNVTTVTFTLDTTGPTATVKPEGTTGADGFYQKVSYKLFDSAKVVKAILNGVEKPLSPNQWSDLNDIKPGVFGAVEGVNTLVLQDALGNQSTTTFTIDTTKPVINTPDSGEWVSGTHTWNISQDEANPAKAYIEIDQMVNGKWKKFAGTWVENTNDLTTSFDTTGLTSGVQTQIKISSWDKAGNQSGASFGVQIDNTAPTISVKPESIGSDGVFSNASFKLFDSLSGVDTVSVNGVVKDLTNNKYSDLNGLKPGKFGAVEGENTIVVTDVAGNTATLKVTLDATAPTVTNESQEWQTKDGGRTSVTLTFSEPVFNLPQGWYGSGTSWTKAFYNTKPSTVTFVDQAGNAGTYTVTPKGAPVTPTQPEKAGVPTTPVSQTGPSSEHHDAQPASHHQDSSGSPSVLASTGSGDLSGLGIGGLLAILLGLLGKFLPFSNR